MQKRRTCNCTTPFISKNGQQLSSFICYIECTPRRKIWLLNEAICTVVASVVAFRYVPSVTCRIQYHQRLQTTQPDYWVIAYALLKHNMHTLFIYHCILSFCHRKRSVPKALCIRVCPSVSESVRPENLVNTISQKSMTEISFNFGNRK